MLTYVLATAGFKHDNYCEASLAKEDHHGKLSLNYNKQFNRGGVTMSCKKGGTYELYFLSVLHKSRLLKK